MTLLETEIKKQRETNDSDYLCTPLLKKNRFVSSSKATPTVRQARNQIARRALEREESGAGSDCDYLSMSENTSVSYSAQSGRDSSNHGC